MHHKRGKKNKTNENIREVLMSNHTGKASTLNISKNIYGFPINMMLSQTHSLHLFPLLIRARDGPHKSKRWGSTFYVCDLSIQCKFRYLHENYVK